MKTEAKSPGAGSRPPGPALGESAAGEGERHPPGPAFLKHHFASPAQQFDSSKLGMWLFLATELLMFGGLFCAYAVYRGTHPEMFAWGSQLLDRTMGLTNTIVLITSSVTMAAAVTFAQRGQRWPQVIALGLTFLGAVGFLGIKYVEYTAKIEHGLLWGRHFDPDPEYLAHHFGAGGHGDGEHGAAVADPHEKPAEVARDLGRGRSIALQTCASCHGPDLRGMVNNGKSLLTSEFVHSKTDPELLAFLKVGRQSWDPENTTGVAMPPRGGNPTLNDEKLLDVIGYLRTVWEEPGQEPAVVEGDGAGVDAEVAAADAELLLPRSVIPPAPPGPAGFAEPVVHAASVPPIPSGAHHFFAVYFMMTGLHGIHVVAGMLVVAWLMVGAARGRYSAAYYTPVDLGGLFWHLVDLIWIFLFALFYVI